MNEFGRFLLFGAAIILGFDLLASLISRGLGISYTWFTLGSLIVYLGIGFRGAPRFGLGKAVKAAVLVAMTEGTIGWAISWVVGPGRIESEFSFAALLIVGLVGALVIGGVGGWVGGAVGLRTAK